MVRIIVVFLLCVFYRILDALRTDCNIIKYIECTIEHLNNTNPSLFESSNITSLLDLIALEAEKCGETTGFSFCDGVPSVPSINWPY